MLTVMAVVISATSETRITTTLPLHPRNLGAPALAVLSTGQESEVRLLGLIEAASSPSPGTPHLTSVRAIAGAFALLGSEEAQAQEKQVLSGT